MPKLVRLYVVHTAIGFGLALAFVALLLGLDVGGLGRLVGETEGGWLAGSMLVVFNGIVFGGAQFGIAVMRLAEDDAGRPPGGRPEAPRAAMELLAVRAR